MSINWLSLIISIIAVTGINSVGMILDTPFFLRAVLLPLICGMVWQAVWPIWLVQ